MYIYTTKTLGEKKNVISGGVRCSKWTPIYSYIKKKTNPSFINNENQRKEKNKGLDIKQIYDHGSQLCPMPGVSVPAACRQ
jgi:hypothetical protein